jgi:hypothetical protein
VPLQWRYSYDPTIAGGPLAVRISLAKQQTPKLKIVNNKIVNKGKYPASVTYYLSDGDTKLLSEVSQLSPGDTFALPDEVKNKTTSIPPEAVTTMMDIAALDDYFYIPSDTDVLTEFMFANMMATNVRPALGNLLRVEITSKVGIANATGHITAFPGPTVTLVPFPAQGSEARQPNAPYPRTHRTSRPLCPPALGCDSAELYAPLWSCHKASPIGFGAGKTRSGG